LSGIYGLLPNLIPPTEIRKGGDWKACARRKKKKP